MQSIEKLRECLKHDVIMKTIVHKEEVTKVKRSLRDAMAVMKQVGISENAINEVEFKLKEYQKTELSYDVLLEETYGLVWQDVEYIKDKLK